MGEKQGKIRFVRIRGRIVPIRAKKKKEVSQGLGLTGGGIATGSLLAFGGGRLKKSGVSRQQLALKFGKQSPGALFLGGVQFKAGTRRIAQSRLFRRSAGLSSAALIGLGVEKLISGLGLEPKGTAGELLSETAGVASATVVAGFFEKGSGGAGLRKQTMRKIKAFKFKGAVRGLTRILSKGKL